MTTGKSHWDSPTELRTRCAKSISLRRVGAVFYTAGKTPLATAVLLDEGRVLDITIRADRVAAELGRKGGSVKSAAKARAARLNGKKGGAPKRKCGSKAAPIAGIVRSRKKVLYSKRLGG
jgi:hypothetical protein